MKGIYIMKKILLSVMALILGEVNADQVEKIYFDIKNESVICKAPDLKLGENPIEAVDALLYEANFKEDRALLLQKAYCILFKLAYDGNKDAIFLISEASLDKKIVEVISKNILLNQKPMTPEQFWTISDYLEGCLYDNKADGKTLFQEAVREAIKNSSEPKPVKRSISDTESEVSPKVKERKINAESPDLTTATAQGSL